MKTNFNVTQNMSLQDLYLAKVRHKLNLLCGLVKYLRAFKNFSTVIDCYRKNNFPMTGILRDGKETLLRNQMHASLTAFLRKDIPIEANFVNLHVMDRDIMLSGWENNTGVSELFIQDCYHMLE